MVRDRSSEFRRRVAVEDEREMVVNGGLDVLENGSLSDSPSNSFFAEVDDVRRLIENLANDITKLKSKQSNILSMPVAEQDDREQLDEYIVAIRQRANVIKPRLMKMKQKLEEDERSASQSRRSSADLRIRRFHIESLIKKLSDVLEMFTLSQSEYRDRVAQRVKRQLELVGEHPTENEVNEMMESKSTQIFYRGLASSVTRSVVEDATNRHNEILKLEKSIEELSEMYNDLAFLVTAQGESVDRIEDNVEHTVTNVEQGRQQTRVAVQYKKGALRKKIYCGLLIAIVVLILLAIIIVFSVVFGGKSNKGS